MVVLESSGATVTLKEQDNLVCNNRTNISKDKIKTNIKRNTFLASSLYRLDNMFFNLKKISNKSKTKSQKETHH